MVSSRRKLPHMHRMHRCVPVHMMACRSTAIAKPWRAERVLRSTCAVGEQARGLATGGRGDGSDGGGKLKTTGWALFPEDDEATKAAKQEKKEILLERMRRSILYDAQAASKEKLFVADDQQLSGDQAVDFPPLSVTLVDSGIPVQLPLHFMGKVTLVTVSFQALGKQQSDLWHAPFAEAFHVNTERPLKGVQMLDLVYLEGLFFSLFSGMITAGTRKAATPAMMPHTAICFERSTPATEMFCHRLNIHNRTMGYAFLVDWTGTVKWTAHYIPSPEECLAMVTVADNMLRQLRTDRG